MSQHTHGRTTALALKSPPAWWHEATYPTWTAEREAVDFAAILDAVPRRERQRVERFLASCGAAGRREAWEEVVHDVPLTRKRMAELVAQLVMCASNAPVPAACSGCGCEGAQLFVVGDGSARCGSCVGPFDSAPGMERQAMAAPASTRRARAA